MSRRYRLALASRPDEVSPGVDHRLGRDVTDLSVIGTASESQHAVLIGNALNNTIIGSAASERIAGRGGNDTIEGRGGNDVLLGGDGNDTIVAGDGRDRLDGGAGNDVLVGGGGNDVLIGGSGNDVLAGGSGRNRLVGGDGDDTFSSDGPANVNGGAGIDHFRNGTAGNWRFVYTSVQDSTPGAIDTFDNFRAYNPYSHGTYDRIDLSHMDADTTRAGQQHFTLVPGPTGHAGELWVIRGGIDGDAGTRFFSWIMGDVNGDGHVDFEVHVPTIIADQNLVL